MMMRRRRRLRLLRGLPPRRPRGLVLGRRAAGRLRPPHGRAVLPGALAAGSAGLPGERRGRRVAAADDDAFQTARAIRGHAAADALDAVGGSSDDSGDSSDDAAPPPRLRRHADAARPRRRLDFDDVSDDEAKAPEAECAICLAPIRDEEAFSTACAHEFHTASWRSRTRRTTARRGASAAALPRRSAARSADPLRGGRRGGARLFLELATRRDG